jgi:hypothetical protein
MGAVVSAFRSVIEVFEIAVKLLLGFPQNIVCLLKLLIMGVVRFVFLQIPGLSHLAVILAYGAGYVLAAAPKLFIAIAHLLVVSLIQLVDLFPWSGGEGSSVGQALHRAMQLFSTCLNDPRAWYATSRHHRGNRYAELFGMFPCMSPCGSGYRTHLGGVLCKKAETTSPEFCPLAAITRTVDGLPFRPSPFHALDEETCTDAGRGFYQTKLADVACSQPSAAAPDNKHLRAACYQRYCASNPATGGIGRCADVVPFEATGNPVGLQLLQIPFLLLSGALTVFCLTSLVQERRNLYAEQHERWAAMFDDPGKKV